MATTATLKALGGIGLDVTVNAGPLEGHSGKLVTIDAFPDGHEHQRKIIMESEGVEHYILPRLLDVVNSGAPTAPVTAEAAAALIQHTQIADSAAGGSIDSMDPMFDQFRPDPSVVQRYISRTLVKSEDSPGYKDVDFFMLLRDDRDAAGYSPNIALVGETQSGKTMLVEALAVLAAERDGKPKPYPIFTLNGSSGISNYDLYGMTTAVTVNGQEQLVWMTGMVPLAAQCDGGILYLDEWNAVPPSQAVAIHPVLDDRRTFTNYQKAVPNGHGGWQPEVVKVNKNLWIISTINPGYKGTQTVAEATSNRFRWIPWDYDEKTERKLIKSKGVYEFGLEMRELYADRLVKVPTGTSALVRIQNDLANLGPDAALQNFVSMFAPKEQAKVMQTYESNGYRDIWLAEFPDPTHMNRKVPEPKIPDSMQGDQSKPDTDTSPEEYLKNLLKVTGN